MTSDSFKGFSPETSHFFNELAMNNERSWFEAHRDQYEAHVLNPFRALVTAMAPGMQAIDPELEIRPAIGKTIARIYRDTRFSKDKSPFRSHLWVAFKRPYKPWQAFPGFFMEIHADRWWYGMGFYMANRNTMDGLREYIRERPEDFQSVLNWQAGHSHFILGGEEYKRPQAPDQPQGIQAWLQKKSIYFSCEGESMEQVYLPGFADHLLNEFETLVPIYHFLWRFATP
ncbi:DUF2461 domain-containing protein [bacterium]|nr:DUF2461 domain-containing protein [bacterium]